MTCHFSSFRFQITFQTVVILVKNWHLFFIVFWVNFVVMINLYDLLLLSLPTLPICVLKKIPSGPDRLCWDHRRQSHLMSLRSSEQMHAATVQILPSAARIVCAGRDGVTRSAAVQPPPTGNLQYLTAELLQRCHQPKRCRS